MSINEFQGEYRFLSNFWLVDIRMSGFVYPSTEHAYQAAKTLVPNERTRIRLADVGMAKKIGRTVTIRPGWEEMKLDVMYQLVRYKFKNYTNLKAKLLYTNDQELIEGNYWHDNFWGSCTCSKCGNAGQNHLGKTLMRIRDELRD